MSTAFFLSKVEQSPDSLLEMVISREQNSAMEKKQCLGKKTFVYRIAIVKKGGLENLLKT